MKQLPWILNGVLALAVIVLFTLHFSQQKKITNLVNQPQEEFIPQDSGQSFRMAYVFVDSLLANYEMYMDLTNGFLKQKESLENQLTSKGSALEKKISDYQYKVQKHLITSWDAAEEEKKLAEEQQVLVNLQSDMQNRLLEDEQRLNQQIHDSVIAAVNRYNQEHNYQLILSHTFGGGLLFAKEYMNVTKEVLDLLNESYKGQKRP